MNKIDCEVVNSRGFKAEDFGRMKSHIRHFEELPKLQQKFLLKLKEGPMHKCYIRGYIKSKIHLEAFLSSVTNVYGWSLWEDDDMVGVL